MYGTEVIMMLVIVVLLIIILWQKTLKIMITWKIIKFVLECLLQTVAEMEEKKELHYVELAYARVSTKNQSLERQETSILGAVPDLKAKYFFKDKYTGKEFDRPQYMKLKEKVLELLEANPDTNIRVTIHELDRLGRNYQEIQKEVYWFRGHKGSKVKRSTLRKN